ncbi:hypothetical protein [Streptomyces sp. CBMA156]|uniref:hypothetical protein n=1 Tax=Streptomyces sp. CBMA156 TaxID=1930280 RepID=UPI001661D1F9|nr:hypothetical protein [Streptomyces sp. CBMA156]MBD0670042.1 hypothetical protein [Streptomyces sp. CBMA156]
MRRVKVGQRLKVKLPHSEVCMHMRVADQVMEVEILAEAVQLYKDGQKFSGPILLGEAGVYVKYVTGRIGRVRELWADVEEVIDYRSIGVGESSDWYYLRCGCQLFVSQPGWNVQSTDISVFCEEMQRLHQEYADVALKNIRAAFPQARAIDEHAGVPKEFLDAEEADRKAKGWVA